MLLGLAGSPALAQVVVNPSSLPAATQGEFYDQAVFGSGGVFPYSFAVTSGALPAGLALNGGTGAVTGTPTTQGIYNFTITATDSTPGTPQTGARAYTFSVGTFSLAVQPNTLPNGRQGVAYNQTLTAVGGTPPYTFNVSSGALPAGLTLAPGGALTGTPTGGGASAFIVRVQDSNGNSGFRTYNMNIGTNSLTISPATLPNGTQGVAYSQSLTTSGGTGPYTYSISSGALPSGMTLNSSTGAISGTPTVAGPFSFTVEAVDSVSNWGTRSYAINIGANSLTINPASLPPGTDGVAYSQSVTASGGTGPYSYSVLSGSLPPGLSLNGATGAITGTPTAGGSFPFTIRAVDANANYGDRSYTLPVGSASLTVAPASLPAGTQGAAYNQTVTASGGTAPYTYTVTSGTLPTGLSLNASTGAITGTPTAPGAFGFTIGATDSITNSGSQAYTVTINPAPLVINPSTLPNGTQGVAYSQAVSAGGGTAPYTYSVSAGALPTGLALNPASGAITGTPTAGGTFNFTIAATDGTSNGSRAYSVSIGTNVLVVLPTSLPAASQGLPYNQTVSASGGTAPYTYALTSGALPAGLSLNASSGAITGTPTANGSFNFTIQATDSLGNVGDRSYALSVGTSSLTINPASLPPGTQGIAYAQSVNATGGTAPYTFAISAGALPAGLSLNGSTGAITGTPASGGTANFTIRGTDSLGNTGTRPYALTIGTATLAVNPASLPNTSQGFPYAQTISATGGTGPYTFAVTAGALPTGLTLNNATGAITGSPTASGAASFTIRATDSVGNIGARAYAFNVGGSSLTLNPSSLAAASYRVPYNQSMSVVGGTAPFAFTVSSGALPPGLVLNPTTGAITGSPTTEGSFAFTILVTDSLGNFGTRAYALSTQRSNPADDPEVRGLVASQAAAARRFADTQSTNVMRRLEALRDRTERCGFDFGVVPIAPDAASPGALGVMPMVDAMQPIGQPGEMTTRREPVPGCDPHLRGSIVSLWANGSLQFGKLGATGGLVGNKFSTSGLTAGIDAFATDRLAVGFALGFGFDETNVGQNGTRSDAHNVSGMAYASYKAFDNVFIDLVAGYGALSFDNRRWVELDRSFVAGSRAGSTLFGSAAVTAEFRPSIYKLAPYARLDASATRLDSFAEDSATSQALTFDKTRFETVAGAVGLRASLDMRSEVGLLTPMVRIEYKRALDGAFIQGMSYSDAPGVFYVLDHTRTTRHQLMAGIGLRGQLSEAMSFELEYGVSASPDQDAWKWQGHSLRGVARWMF